MALQAQRDVFQTPLEESLKFNSKNIRAVDIKDVDQCLVAKDVSKVVVYNNDDNARRAVRTHVPGKYRMSLETLKYIEGEGKY